VIDLGTYKLQVVEACSGLRYLYPLMSVGFLMAYMYQGALRWRILLFLATIPLTILMNSMRISAVGILVERWGSGMADGFMHYFEGWVIFLVCLVFLVGMVWVIEYFGSRRPVMECLRFPNVAARRAPVVTDDSGGQWTARLAFFLLLGASLIVPVVGAREEIRPERLPLVMFPTQLGSWQQGKEKALDSNVERGLGVDDYLIRDYVSPDRRLVNFYVAYYGSQRKGVSPHSPEVCIPGGGWLITSLARMPVRLDDGSSFDVVRAVVEREGQRQLVYYWFEQRGHRIANEYLMKWHLLLDALFRNRSDGALVRLVTPVGQDEPLAMADERLKEMVRLASPRLEKFVPR
jgi:exosortase D (VPLPA-CTERM-specific)